MLNVIFTSHAKHQMQVRNISERVVILALGCPDKIIKQNSKRAKIVKIIQRKSKKYLIIVVCEQDGENMVVVTAFITSKIKKYL